MKKTSIFNFKPFSKINPPLPRTPRESQQLLNALTSSFRRQLDREFPTHPSPSPPSPPSSSSSRPTEHGRRTVAGSSHSSLHATDRHLESILENPLFRVVPSRQTSGHDVSGNLQSIEGKRMLVEPMTVFDELVASGSVTETALFACLTSQLHLASAQTGTSVHQALKDSKAGSKVVSWWHASDLTSKKMLLKSYTSMSILLKFMVAEGLQDTATGWLDMLLRHDLGGHNGQIPSQLARSASRSLLADLINAETQYGRGLGAAMTSYLQICRRHLSAADQRFHQEKKITLVHGGARLGRLVMQQEVAKDVPGEHYEEFLELVRTLAPKSMLSAFVPIYHPTRPDVEPFLKFLASLPPGRPESWVDAKREGFMRAAFDALRVLIDREDFGDALYLARCLQKMLPGKDHASSEEEFLLNRLDLALT